MWYTLVHVFVVVCLLACGRLTAAAVADLTTDTQFREAIEQPDRVILVDFYAPWCGSCKKLSPKLDELSVAHGDTLQVIKVDATQYVDLASEFAVTSFPKIVYFLNGKAFDYAGVRTVEEFAQFATRLKLDRIVTVSSEADLANILAQNGVAIMLRVAPESHGDLLESAFLRAAETYHGRVCFIRWIGSVSPGSPAVTIQKLDSQVDFGIFFVADTTTDSLSIHSVTRSLIDFVEFHNREYISTINSRNFKQLGGLGKNLAIVALNIGDQSANDAAAVHSAELEILRGAAVSIHKEIENSLVIGVLDSVKHAKYLRKYSATAPSLLVVNMEANSFFLFSNDIFRNEDSLALALREASMMESHGDESNGMGIDVENGVSRRMKSLHHHIRRVGIFERAKDRFDGYYPYSVIFILLPITLLAISTFMTNPRHLKTKMN